MGSKIFVQLITFRLFFTVIHRMMAGGKCVYWIWVFIWKLKKIQITIVPS